MTESTYMMAQEVADALGVSVATVYAYVSRGMIRSETIEESSRVRRYLREDVERLLNRKAARSQPEKVARNAAQSALYWGTPVLESAITLIQDGKLYYRGYNAVELSRTHLFEEVAGLIWADEMDISDIFDAENRVDTEALLAQLSPVNLMTRLQMLVPLMAAHDPAAFDLRPERVMRAGARLLRALADTVIGKISDPVKPLAESLASGLLPDANHAAQLLNTALILCADHELNASSFTARVVAGTGATPYAVVSAGLASLSGIKHGGITEQVTAFWQEVGSAQRAEAVILDRLRRGDRVPGFGHVLYPGGDVRGRALLDDIYLALPDSAATQQARAIEQAVTQIMALAPTIDFALVSLVQALNIQDDLPLVIFALGRTAGWIGHMIEQLEDDQMIRPRANYNGRKPKF